MKQPYLKVNPPHNYLKEPFKFRPVYDTAHTLHLTRAGFTGERISDQPAPKKNDNGIYDFFGALNY